MRSSAAAGSGGSPAARDFDGDGFTDLAVTVSTDADGHVGTVMLWGSSAGLSGGMTLPGGRGLHGGDFDGVGRTDLLLDNYYGSGRQDGDGPSVLYGEHGQVQESGAVWILHGTAKGLSTTNVTSFGPAALGALRRATTGPTSPPDSPVAAGRWRWAATGCPVGIGCRPLLPRLPGHRIGQSAGIRPPGPGRSGIPPRRRAARHG
ncbi:hypothetical protein AB0I10_18130 [Streptomyces sp. NPDC050636]|uniref:hypothetical protein n=1 Tax=Streptomyces sp. NPDC050636 TaxID=3154510 RepID=UPI00342503E3